MTPAAILDGTAVAITDKRVVTLDAAFAAHPTRFKGVAAKLPVLPTAAWIYPPKAKSGPASSEQVSSLIQ